VGCPQSNYYATRSFKGLGRIYAQPVCAAGLFVYVGNPFYSAIGLDQVGG
jgi:hypothetical protein